MVGAVAVGGEDADDTGEEVGVKQVLFLWSEEVDGEVKRGDNQCRAFDTDS